MDYYVLCKKNSDWKWGATSLLLDSNTLVFFDSSLGSNIIQKFADKVYEEGKLSLEILEEYVKSNSDINNENDESDNKMIFKQENENYIEKYNLNSYVDTTTNWAVFAIGSATGDFLRSKYESDVIGTLNDLSPEDELSKEMDKIESATDGKWTKAEIIRRIKDDLNYYDMFDNLRSVDIVTKEEAYGSCTGKDELVEAMCKKCICQVTKIKLDF